MLTIQHIDDTVWELALGTEPDPSVQGHLDACPRCRTLLADTRELAVLLAASRPVLPSDRSLRAQLVGEAAHHAGTRGLRHRIEGVAAHLGISPAEAEAVLTRLADPAAWAPMFPGFSVHMLRSTDGVDRGFARADPGTRFPDHRHRGAEHILVLQGSCDDSSAGWLGPGDRVVHDAGTCHSFTVPATVPLVFAFTSRGFELVAP